MKKNDWQKLDQKMQKIVSENQVIKNQKKTGTLKLNRDTNLGELIQSYPNLADTLINDYDLHCANCMLAGFDTLYEGAKLHGMTDQEIDKMILRLKKIKNK